MLPAFIRKMHEVKQRGDKQVVVWGTGTPRREFFYSDDMADACIFLMNILGGAFDSVISHKSINPPLINIGCGEDLTILELAELVKTVVGFEGEIVLDRSKPDGTPRKLMDVSKMNQLGWQAKTSLQSGISRTCQDYLEMLQ